MSPADAGSGTAEDPTARTRIRDAALIHFGEEGYERATIRTIALTAGVSHGMLRHHFGSKVSLRTACDNYIVAVLHRLNTVVLDAPTTAARSQQCSRRFWRYVARSLAEGSPTAAPIFDEMVTMTERWLLRADGIRPDGPAIEGRSRAALVAAMAAGIPLLHEHLSRTAGVDVFTPEGHHLMELALFDFPVCGPRDDEGDSTPASIAI